MKPLSALCTALLFLGAAFTALGVTIPASEDSYSSRGQLTKVANRASALLVDATHTGYVYFDLADIGVTLASDIRQARLRLFFPRVSAVGGGLNVHVVTDAWDEAVATAEPSHDSVPLAAIPAIALRAKSFASVDVTAAVRSWMGHSVVNQGFAVRAISGAKLLVGAKEGTGSGYLAVLEVELNSTSGVVGSAQLGPDLVLSGTTSGTFSGNGAALTALQAASITGQLINEQLANSGLTFNLGPGLEGSGSVALGGTVALTNSGVLSLAGGGGITVSAGNGHVTLNSSATVAATPGSIVLRDSSGSFSAGAITAAQFNGRGALPWQAINGTAQTAGPNVGYLAIDDGLVTLTLPETAVAGDLVRVTGVGAGGWLILAPPGQAITGFGAGQGPGGAQGATGAVQFVGQNKWQPVNETQIAAGTINTVQLAQGAVQEANIAGGAVTNVKLANDRVTITTGSGLSGGGALPLGGSLALVNTGVTSLTSSGGITVSGANGAVSVGTNATSGNIAGSIVQRDANGNFAAGNITASFSGNGAALTNLTAANLTGQITNTQLGPNAVQSGNIAPGTAVTSLSGGGGITVSSGTGSVTLGSSATSANTANSIVLRDATGGFTAGPIVAANIAGDGAGLTGLNAANLATGTVPGERLSGSYSNGLDLPNPANTLAGSFTATGDANMQGNVLKNSALGMLLHTVSFPGPTISFQTGGSIQNPLVVDRGASLNLPSIDKPGTFFSARISISPQSAVGQTGHVIIGGTNNGFGFKNVATALKGITVANSIETEIDLATPANSTSSVLAVRRASSVDFYVNGVLKGRSFTNLPTSGSTYTLRLFNAAPLNGSGGEQAAISMAVACMTIGSPIF
jgi:hypothetical protein